MVSQRQLEVLAILNAFYHLLNHSIRQGEAEDIRDCRADRLLGAPREALQRQAGLWYIEGRHLEGDLPKRGEVRRGLFVVGIRCQIQGAG